MEITEERRADILILHVSGKLDAAAANGTQRASGTTPSDDRGAELQGYGH